MYSSLFEVKTTKDRDLLLSEIEAIKSAAFETKKGLEGVLAASVRAETAAVIKDKIAKKENLEVFLDETVKSLEAMNEVNLELAFEPSNEIIGKIYSWVSTNAGEGHVLSLSINPRIIAGATISFKGKYYDGSLAASVEKVFSTNKKQILETLNSK